MEEKERIDVGFLLSQIPDRWMGGWVGGWLANFLIGKVGIMEAHTQPGPASYFSLVLTNHNHQKI